MLIPVRDALREVLRNQVENQPWGGAQVKLRIAYGAFVRTFGPINLTTTTRNTDADTGAVTETQRRPNLAPFADDPDCWLVASIEDYDPESGTAKKGPVFSERVIHPPAEPVIVTATDALAVTLAEVGHVDLDRVAELLGRSREDTVASWVRRCSSTRRRPTRRAGEGGRPRTPTCRARCAASWRRPRRRRGTTPGTAATSKP